MKSKIFQKIKKELTEIKTNVLLRNHTTFKIGGPAKYFFVAKKKEDLMKTILMAKKFKLPFFVLGGGSKLLVSDRGFKGLIIKIQNSKFKIKNSKIWTEGGLTLSKLVNLAQKNNLAGLEWAAGIPGATISGAIRGNAGAFGNSMKNIVREIEIFDTKTEKIKILKNKDCKFGYRDSIFKKKKNLIILSTTLQLKKGKKKAIKRKLNQYLNYRKETQPLNFLSAGSIFKNPSGFSAGKLIEECGLKGKKIGNVKISEKHANFIVNLGNGKAKDVKKLINLIKNKVKKKFGIVLKEEIQFLGF